MIFLIIFAVITAFISGLFVGMKLKPDKAVNFKKSSENLQNIQNEYQNFLNYDGSVQQ